MTEHLNATSASQRAMAHHLVKYLTFLVGGQEYCLSIEHVEEIVGMVPITRLPNSLAHVRGVINLRGRVVPAVDLRTRLGLSTQDDTRSTCIIVTEIPGEEGRLRVGLVVDAVDDVVDIDPGEIQPADGFMNEGGAGLLQGAGVVKERVRLMLDLGRVLSRQQQRALAEIANAA